MLKPTFILVLATVLVFGAAGCHDRWDYGTEVSVCDAVQIASREVPSKIVTSSPAAGFRQELGPNGTWFVTFPNVNTTLAELGWDESKPYTISDNTTGQDIPAGTLRNVTIYVDAKTGEVTGRELSNGLFLGGPDVFPDCDG
jgi:hypothetical protein